MAPVYVDVLADILSKRGYALPALEVLDLMEKEGQLHQHSLTYKAKNKLGVVIVRDKHSFWVWPAAEVTAWLGAQLTDQPQPEDHFIKLGEVQGYKPMAVQVASRKLGGLTRKLIDGRWHWYDAINYRGAEAADQQVAEEEL
jgi:hypothetical protein